MEARDSYMLRSRISGSYSEIIVVRNADAIIADQTLMGELPEEFMVHIYDNEIRLRVFRGRHRGKRIIILVGQGSDYLPWEIEQRADIIILSGEDPAKSGAATQESTGEYLTFLSSRISSCLAQTPVNWRELAPLWGEASYFKDTGKCQFNDYITLDQLITEDFKDFIYSKYDELFFQTYHSGPVLVSQVMPYLASKNYDKLALLCFDGMGFQEWCLIKNYLIQNGIEGFQESAIYTLIPTLTWASRTALFSGQSKVPGSSSVNEKKAFTEQIAGNWPQGNSKKTGWFVNIDQRWHAEYLEYECLGLVLNVVDEHAHSAILMTGSKQRMQAALGQFLQDTEIAAIFSHLLEENYRIFISSDHGTVWCKGNGYRSEKSLAEDRARRSLMFSNALLAQDFGQGKNVQLYANPSMLQDRMLVLPQGRDMFANVGEMAISHGGIHIEEVLIPFVEVIR